MNADKKGLDIYIKKGNWLNNQLSFFVLAGLQPVANNKIFPY